MDEDVVGASRAQSRSIRFVAHEPNCHHRSGYFSLELRTEQMEASYPDPIDVHDVETLRDSLAKIYRLAGTAIEERLPLAFGAAIISLRLDALGHVEVEVEAGIDLYYGPRIRFIMMADQSYFPIWMRSIDRALETLSSA